jgi:hypothetical protein
MCVNAKIIPVEAVPAKRRGEMGNSSRKGKFNYDIFNTL